MLSYQWWNWGPKKGRRLDALWSFLGLPKKVGGFGGLGQDLLPECWCQPLHKARQLEWCSDFSISADAFCGDENPAACSSTGAQRTQCINRDPARFDSVNKGRNVFGSNMHWQAGRPSFVFSKSCPSFRIWFNSPLPPRSLLWPPTTLTWPPIVQRRLSEGSLDSAIHRNPTFPICCYVSFWPVCEVMSPTRSSCPVEGLPLILVSILQHNSVPRSRKLMDSFRLDNDLFCLLPYPPKATWTYSTASGFPRGSVVKESACNAGDTGVAVSITGSGRFPGGGNGNPLQCSCLGNPVDRGAWWATVHGIARNQAEATEHMTCLHACQGFPICLARSDEFTIIYIHLELQSWEIPCHTGEDWRSGKLSQPLDLGRDADQSDRWVQSHTWAD